MSTKIYTSESVTEGHPDKLCDVVVDSVLDAFLEKDRFARVDCSALVTRGLIALSGEVTTKTYVDLDDLVRGTIREIGYDRAELGFDYRSIGVLTFIREQSQQLGKIVDMRLAGDQSMTVGYATDEARDLGCSLDYMPVPISLAHRIMKRLSEARRSSALPYLRPDGKGQVSVIYENGRPKAINAITVAAQHDPKVKLDRLDSDIFEHVVKPVFDELGCPVEPKCVHVNPGGPFIDGGPLIDTGESGRKIVVDSYGGLSRHGGSSFSGKDPTKLDRSGAYFARYLAKNVVGAGVASRCEVTLAYCIGSPDPISLAIETFGTSPVPDEEIASFVTEKFDLTPAGILERLELRVPIYRATSAYGHFGRSDREFPWERCDAMEIMKEMVEGRK